MTFLSKNITFLRKSRKMSQQTLASALQLSRSNIASYESGKAEPRAAKLVEIARFFDVSLTQLIEENIESLTPGKIRASNANIQEKLNQLVEKRKVDFATFQLKTDRLRKVTIGLRAHFELKNSRITDPTPEVAAMQKDMETLLEVMDNLVDSNSEIIAYIESILE